MAGVSPDPLAPLVGLPGVADAVRRAREAVVALHRHPVNRTGWAASAAEAALRAARASAVLDGAVRAAEATGRLLGTWRTAPLQALARLHVLAAADLGGPDADSDADSGAAPGRPVRGTERLALLAELVTGGTAVPAPVLVAVVHGELLTLEPFGSANGVVARAAARRAAISSGLDPRGREVPEV